MLVLLGIGFLAGLATAISPCVLPVLPILLAGGASGRKPFRIIAGLVASFVVFTLFATWLLNQLGLPDDLLRNVAIALLFVVAATLLVPRLGLLIEKPFARLTRFRAGGGGFLLGASLGLVFVPCAGPVLATISVVAATNNVGLRAILLTLAYALGAALPMLLIALGGQRIGKRLRTEAPRVRMAAGVVIGLVAIAIAFNLDTRFQTALPGYTAGAPEAHRGDRAPPSGRSRRSAAASGRSSTRRRRPPRRRSPRRARRLEPAGDRPEGAADHRRAATGSTRSRSRSPRSAGRSCCSTSGRTRASTACARSRTWRPGTRRYHPYGLVIIGVHSPEFAFEHVASNVARCDQAARDPATRSSRTTTSRTWTNYSNEYWPAEYLIDQQGRIRAYDFGEGNYADMEQNIRELLGVSDRGRRGARPDADRPDDARVVPRLRAARPDRATPAASSPRTG